MDVKKAEIIKLKDLPKTKPKSQNEMNIEKFKANQKKSDQLLQQLVKDKEETLEKLSLSIISMYIEVE